MQAINTLTAQNQALKAALIKMLAFSDARMVPGISGQRTQAEASLADEVSDLLASLT